ncbi:MAG: hypothetical protein WCG80_13060 [Spirochaetales bacterium]
MLTKNSDILNKIDRLAAHYTANVANKFIKDEFRNLGLEHRTWNDIESLTEKNAQFRIDGYYMDDLYIKLHSLALFVHAARTKLLPQLKSLVASHGSRRSPQEKTLADIAATNFGSNLGILADQLNDIFTLATKDDAEQSRGKPTVLSKLSELKDFGSLLVL